MHGGDDYRVFEVAAGVTATISHLTMRDGTATPANNFFGGNLTSAGNLTLDHVHVTNGIGYSAGGLANRGGTMTVQNSLIDQNSRANGGGDAGAILNFGGDGPPGDASVRDSTIAFNSARLTGGISRVRQSRRLDHARARDGRLQQLRRPRRRGDAGDSTVHVSGSIVASNFSQGVGGPTAARVVDDGATSSPARSAASTSRTTAGWSATR